MSSVKTIAPNATIAQQAIFTDCRILHSPKVGRHSTALREL
jgi:hypothetical protein